MPAITWNPCPKCNNTHIAVQGTNLWCQECGHVWDNDDTQPILQLLVIDLGDTTVVKVEKGGNCRIKMPNGVYAYLEDTVVLQWSFTAVQEALDNKTYPYLSKDGKNYRLHYSYGRGLTIEQDAYDAITELVGSIPVKPMMQSKWEALISPDTIADQQMPVQIWRYTRYVDS